MREVSSDEEILFEIIDFKNKTVLDIGCGTGDLVRWMTKEGANVIGIDVPEMLKHAIEPEKIGNEKYLEGGGENIPVDNSIADIVVFVASFHHIPLHKMREAFCECNRVLKPNGIIILIEPVAERGSYYDIIKLVEDEAEIQQQAYEAIRNSSYEPVDEKFFYMERSINDYIKLLNIFVGDEKERKIYISKAKDITIHLATKNNQTIEEFRYKSIARLNILKKHD